MKLCINPSCSSHCDIIMDNGRWRFANGFQMELTKTQLQNFNPKSETNLCDSCEGVIDLLVSLKLLPQPKD